MRIADLRVDTDHQWSHEIEVFRLPNNVMLIAFLFILSFLFCVFMWNLRNKISVETIKYVYFKVCSYYKNTREIKYVYFKVSG